MEISERKKRILAAVIDEYISTAEPVGSKTISKNSGLGISSATIRNEMAELEALGFLEQPHTSAGRIPSPQGYRMYVNELMSRHKLSIEETEAINSSLNLRMKQLDKVITDVGKLASKLTNYPAYALAAPSAATIKRFDIVFVDEHSFIVVAMLSNNEVKNKLVQLDCVVDRESLQKMLTLFNNSFTGISNDKITPQLVSNMERAAMDENGITSVLAAFAIDILTDTSSGEAFLTGASHLLQQPEYRDPDKAHRLLNYLSDSDKLLALPNLDAASDIKVIIGPENIADELKDSSVVMASYDAGNDMRGFIGVVGPTRMDYSQVAAQLSYIADGLSKVLKGGQLPPSAEIPKLENNISSVGGDDIDERQE